MNSSAHRTADNFHISRKEYCTCPGVLHLSCGAKTSHKQNEKIEPDVDFGPGSQVRAEDANCNNHRMIRKTK